MDKIKLALKSRTFWTSVVLFLFNTVTALHTLIPASYVPLVDAILGLLVVKFHLSPSQDYTSQKE